MKMKINFIFYSFLLVFLTITGLAIASNEKIIYLRCQGDGWDYQVTITGQPGQKSVVYKLQHFDSYSSFRN